MAEKKSLDFPKWLEAAIIIVLLVMGVIECMHDQWIWGGIFSVVGLAFGIGLGLRFLGGGKRDGE